MMRCTWFLSLSLKLKSDGNDAIWLIQVFENRIFIERNVYGTYAAPYDFSFWPVVKVGYITCITMYIYVCVY